MYTIVNNKTTKEIIMEFEKRKYYSFRLSVEDIAVLNDWATKNDVTVAYCARRAIKDFILKYVGKNIIPPAEKLNFGAIKKEETYIGGENKTND